MSILRGVKMSTRALNLAKRSGRTVLLVALLWLRPVVRLPLRLVSYASLAVFVLSFLVPDTVDPRGKVLLGVVAGVGTMLLTWLYDELLALLAGDDETLLAGI
jgi:hypothetical protein